MRLFFGLLLSIAALFADGISADEYRARRAELRKSLDGVMVLFAANEPEDLHVSFFQDTNFLYLSGWREPGAAMMLTKNEEILFLPERNPRQEIFTGRKAGSGRCRRSAADRIRQGLAEACDRGDVPASARDIDARVHDADRSAGAEAGAVCAVS